jgi:hypothetical protein
MGMFTTYTHSGPIVQIEVGLLAAIYKELGYKSPEGDTNSLLIIPLALSTDAVDFHLSFTAVGGYTKQCHFCVRLEGRQNECLYWFYSLHETSTGVLAWSWDGCAGQGDASVIQRSRTMMVPFNSMPLTRFLDTLNTWISTNKAELMNKRVATLTDTGARSGTQDQRTVQRRA